MNGCDHYEPLGPYDRTLLNSESEEKRFVPKQTSLRDRTYFDPGYFGVMAQSQFTLCPRGDEPWSMRFFEAIMCRSIPIVEDPTHNGRNALEREIGYRFYTVDEELEYRPDWVEAILEAKELVPSGPFILPVAVDDVPTSIDVLPTDFGAPAWESLPHAGPSSEFVDKVVKFQRSYRSASVA